MTDYISREAALDRIVGYDFQHCPDYMEDWATELKHAVICDLKDAVETLPAADVAPVRRAVWRRYSPFTDTYECSNCGEQVIDEQFRTNYCPNCGARMDGGAEE